MPGCSIAAFQSLDFEQQNLEIALHSAKGGAVETGCSGLHYIVGCCLLHNTTPILCTLLALHPPVMNTQSRSGPIRDLWGPPTNSSFARTLDCDFRVYIYIYIYMYVYRYVYTYIYIYMYIGYSYIYIYTHTYTYTHIHIYVYIYIYTCMCIYIYT